MPASDSEAEQAVLPLTPLQRLGVSQEHANHPASIQLMKAWDRFTLGDSPGTRQLLANLQQDPNLPEDLRKGVQILDKATRVDKTHLVVGLLCLALFVTLLVLVY